MTVLNSNITEEMTLVENPQEIINEIINTPIIVWDYVKELQISYDRSVSIKTQKSFPFQLKQWRKILYKNEEVINLKYLDFEIVKTFEIKELEKYFYKNWHIEKERPTKYLLPYFFFSAIRDISNIIAYMKENSIDKLSLYTEWYENLLETYTLSDLETIKEALK